MAFESMPESGKSFIMDASPDAGGQGLGPSPLEALVSSVAACAAMDVISILRKKKQEVTAYRIEIDGVRGPEGVYPRPYTSLHVRHFVSGTNLDPVAVARSVQLSDTKYCSVVSTLRLGPEITMDWAIDTV